MNTIAEEKKLVEWSVAGRPMPGQAVSGDLHVVEYFDRGVLLAAIDGLGHGQDAQIAAKAAAGVLKASPSESVVALVQSCHVALARTRGAVMTVAAIDLETRTMTWTGVGNVEARLFRSRPGHNRVCEHILLLNVIVGLKLPALQAASVPLAPGDLLVFVTDGIQSGFESSVNLYEPSSQVADRILRQHSKRTDDALVLVARYSR